MKDRFRKVCYSFTSTNIHFRLNCARQQLQPTSLCLQHQTAALLTVLSSLGGSSLAWYPPLPAHLCNYCSGQEVHQTMGGSHSNLLTGYQLWPPQSPQTKMGAHQCGVLMDVLGWLAICVHHHQCKDLWLNKGRQGGYSQLLTGTRLKGSLFCVLFSCLHVVVYTCRVVVMCFVSFVFLTYLFVAYFPFEQRQIRRGSAICGLVRARLKRSLYRITQEEICG